MDAPPAPQVTLLDGFSIRLERGGQQPVGVLPLGVQRLVARLCLAGRPTRAALAGDLWPDVTEEQAYGCLRTALWRLHKLAPGLVEVSGRSVALAPGVRVDVRELDDWARRVADPAAAAEQLELPAAGLSGDLLPGWYDDWVLLEREHIRQLRMHALESVAGRLAGAGRYGPALEAAYAAVRTEPLRESAHRTVVRVHLAEGNLGEALRAYQTFAGLLAQELGVPPTEQMRALVAGLHRTRPR